jgi:hypothetical protein
MRETPEVFLRSMVCVFKVVGYMLDCAVPARVASSVHGYGLSGGGLSGWLGGEGGVTAGARCGLMAHLVYWDRGSIWSFTICACACGQRLSVEG